MKCDLWQRKLPCYFCTEGVKGRRYYPGHRGQAPRPVQREGLSAMIKRQSGSNSSASGRTHAALDAVMLAERPLLMEYLVDMLFEDGSERQTATLLIFAADGVWKACLNDRAEEQALWASGASIASALDALESMLDSSSPEWKRTNKPPARKRP